MTKQAPTEHPVHALIRSRWSPYVFASREVRQDDLASIFEAARWTASAYNEQPWRFFVAPKGQRSQYQRILDCLEEGNQRWAGRAPVLALGAAKTTFSRNGEANRVALYDLGQALATLTIEAISRGIHVHQMAGIVPDKAKSQLGVPDGYEAVVAFALGYPDRTGAGPVKLRELDDRPRGRRPLGELVFGSEWGRPAF